MHYRQQIQNEISDLANFALCDVDFRPIEFGEDGDFDKNVDGEDGIEIMSGSVREKIAYAPSLGMHVLQRKCMVSLLASRHRIFSANIGC